MLIIAQPRAASTSLLYTLTEIGNKKAVKGIMRKKACEGFPEMRKLHRIIGERTFETIKNVCANKQVIYRMHLLPIKKHLNYLGKIKDNYIILLRDPIGTLNSYKRFVAKRDFKFLLGELINFNMSYKIFARDKKNILVIDFQDLVDNNKKTILSIMKHLKIKGNVMALKKLNVAKRKK